MELNRSIQCPQAGKDFFLFPLSRHFQIQLFFECFPNDRKNARLHLVQNDFLLTAKLQQVLPFQYLLRDNSHKSLRSICRNCIGLFYPIFRCNNNSMYYHENHLNTARLFQELHYYAKP